VVTPAKTSEQEAIAQINRAFGLNRPRRVAAQAPASPAAVAEARAALEAMQARAHVEEIHHVSALGRPFMSRIYTFGDALPAVSAKAA